MIFNARKIGKTDIIVGIPSYNEAKNIGFVVRQVSKGLKRYFPDKNSLIVNVDNNSEDKTKEVFLRTKSSIPKIYLSTRPGLKGKGYNFYSLFNFIKERSSPVNIVVDADLRSVRPEWMKRMTMPITRGYDFIAPFYIRNKRDALITNHFCYPLIYGLLGWDIAQPIGGDFSFSLEMVRHWLSKKWSKSIYHYGIDIFMTTEAILNDFRVCQVNLGRKIHKLTGLKLNSMFLEVVNVLFGQLIAYKRFWKDDKIKKPKTFYREETIHPQIIDFEYDGFRDIFNLGIQANEKKIKKILTPNNYQVLRELNQLEEKKLGPDLWSKIVYDFLYYYEKHPRDKKLIQILEILAFGRFFSHIKLTEGLNFDQSRKEVIKQAKIFRRHREYLLK